MGYNSQQQMVNNNIYIYIYVDGILIISTIVNDKWLIILRYYHNICWYTTINDEQQWNNGKPLVLLNES